MYTALFIYLITEPEHGLFTQIGILKNKEETSSRPGVILSVSIAFRLLNQAELS